VVGDTEICLPHDMHNIGTKRYEKNYSLHSLRLWSNRNSDNGREER
jgi:hypothetical protein